MSGSELTMMTDIGSPTDASPPGSKEASASGDPTVDRDEGTDISDEAEATDEGDHIEAGGAPPGPVGRFSWRRLLAYGAVPALALILALGAAYLKWQDDSAALSQAAVEESTQAASASTIAMLTYHPDTVDKDLTAAANRMTGTFRAEYTKLINDIVIPGAKQKKISAVATVPGAASVSATENHAVVLVFVNQAITIGDGAPTDNASTVRVTLDKVHKQWLISHFDPI